MRTRDLMKHRYAFGEVRQQLAEMDRAVHLAYSTDPNRVVGEAQRRAYADRLRKLSGMLRDAAGVIEPAPRTIPVNPADPLGPRMLAPEAAWGDMSPAARLKLFDPIENAKMAKHLYDRQREEEDAHPWRGSRFVASSVSIENTIAELAASNPTVAEGVQPTFTVGRYGRTFAITKEPGPPWWRLDRRIRNRWNSWRGIG